MQKMGILLQRCLNNRKHQQKKSSRSKVKRCMILLLVVFLVVSFFFSNKDEIWIATNGCTGLGFPLLSSRTLVKNFENGIGRGSGFCLCSYNIITRPKGCLHEPVICGKECKLEENLVLGTPRSLCVKKKSKSKTKQKRIHKNFSSLSSLFSKFSISPIVTKLIGKKLTKEQVLFNSLNAKFSSKLKIKFPLPSRINNEVDFTSFKKHLHREDIRKIRSSLMKFKVNSSILNYSPSYFPGDKGIVIVGGGASKYRTSFWISIHCIRRVDPKIPIELWFPENDNPLDIDASTYLKAMDVQIRSFEEIYGSNRLHRPKTFELKIFALLFSTFKEVLFLDSDNLPISSLKNLFEDSMFLKYGSLHWKDFWVSTAAPDSFDIFGNKSAVDHSYESGQILVNKEKTWPALVLALYMTMNSNVFYPLTVGYMGYGDKEIIPYALRYLDISYGIVPHGPDHVGVFEKDNIYGSRRVYGNTMMQHDTDGKPLLLHTNLGKWTTHVPTLVGNYIFRWQASKIHKSNLRNVINERAGLDLERWIYELLLNNACFFDPSKPKHWYQKLGIGPLLEGMFIEESPLRNLDLLVFKRDGEVLSATKSSI